MLGENKPTPDATSDGGVVPNRPVEERSNLLIIEDAPACNLLQAQKFDCITLDLGLGEHVGCEMLFHLAKIRCKARVIIISGSEKSLCSARIGRSLNLNICEPLPKPIDLKVLREMLEHIRMQSQLEKLATSSI